LPFKIRLLGRLLRILTLSFVIFLRYGLHYGFSFLSSRETLLLRRSRLHRAQAGRLKRSAIALKGVLIKVGQFLSARVDILPEEFCVGLADLQDAVPPADIGAIRARIREELGKEPEAVFEKFNPQPIAAASLGQVHEAVLKTGERVAVKVQYPGIQQVVEMDLLAARWVLRVLSWWYRRIRWDILYREFSNLLLHELDYIQEGRNADRFRENFSGVHSILAPRVIWDYTTAHILTLEFLDGIKVTDFEAVRRAGIELPELSRVLVDSYMQQIFRHRFMHGDPHPGNLFVRPGPVLIFVDFGLMQPFSRSMREGIRITAGGIIERNIPRIVKGLETLGFIGPDGDLEPIERMAAFFIDKYRDISPKTLREIGLGVISDDMEQLLSVSSTIQIPNNFILIWRTIGMLNGLSSKLDPNLNIIEIAKPYAMPFIKEEEVDWTDKLISKGREIAESLLALPSLTEKFLVTANRGEFKTRMSSEDVTGALLRLYRLVFRAVSGGFILALWAASRFFELQGYRYDALLSQSGAAVFGILLIGSFFRKGRR
jgi:predicted unusual protein kinase regulating ubiquinone biosynthesis (AarF/ABC1/UbiB family)